MNKIIIEVRDGSIIGIFSTNPETRIVIVDYDLIDDGQNPVSISALEPNATFQDGKGYLMYGNTEATDIEISDELKRLKF